MTVESLINRLTQYASWLYYRRWEAWEIVAVVIVVAGLLLLVGAWRRAGTGERRLRERSPIVGIDMAAHKRH